MQNLRDKLEKEGKIKVNKKEMERLSRLERRLLARLSDQLPGQRQDRWPRSFWQTAVSARATASAGFVL